jgi:hypothetical protein
MKQKNTEPLLRVLLNKDENYSPSLTSTKQTLFESHASHGGGEGKVYHCIKAEPPTRFELVT